jgi:hypothetical protein
MKTMKIYLRAVEQNEKNKLALFDSNRNGGIDDLTTEVPAGAIIIWQLDYLSGIKSITRVYSKKGNGNVFKTEPKKRLLCKGFTLQLSKDASGEEAYAIDYILCDGRKVTIDPYIRIIPPK